MKTTAISRPAVCLSFLSSLIWRISLCKDLFGRALQKDIFLTPPPKTILEEKLWLALLWNHTLRDFWRQELGSLFYEKMLQMVPRSWILDPQPLPYHAEHPQLGIHDWSELSEFTQSRRELVLKSADFLKRLGLRGVGSGASPKE